MACGTCGNCCSVLSAAAIVLLFVLRVNISQANEAFLIFDDEKDLALDNIHTAILYYAGCFGLSMICVLQNYCSKDNGELVPLSGNEQSQLVGDGAITNYGL